MIVISGALVLVALVLLVIGLISTALPFVYASIAVSVVSFVFLLVGILQRRGEQLPEDAGSAAVPAMPPLPGAPGAPIALPSSTRSEVEGVTAIIPAGRRSAVEDPAAPAAPVVEAPVAATGPVLVVEGRPRYHVAGCRYLTGKDPQEVPVEKARADGFSACGVCKPEQALTARPALVVDPAAEPAAEPAGSEVPPIEVEEPVAAARRTTRKAPVSRGSVAKAPVAKAPVAKAPVAKAAATPARRAPAKQAATQPAAKKAAAVAKAAPAKRAAPARTAAPAKNAAPAKKAAPASKSVPAKKAVVVKAPAKVAKAPAKKAPVKKATRS